MTFAEFYDKGIFGDELIPVCGDRGTIILDGRETIQSQIEACDKYMKEKSYKAYKIVKGETINRGVVDVYDSQNNSGVVADEK